MARGRKNKPEIDICRVRTDRLRDMTPKQLERAAYRVGRLFEIPKKQQGETKPRWLISKFIADLRASKAKTFGEQFAIDSKPWIGAGANAYEAKMAVFYREEADRIERKIWQMQQKRGCKLPGSEVVARDAIMDAENRGQKPDPDLIDKIRGRRRPKIR